MDFSFSEKEEAFRREVREFLAVHNPNRSTGGTSDGEEDLESMVDKLPKPDLIGPKLADFDALKANWTG